LDARSRTSRGTEAMTAEQIANVWRMVAMIAAKLQEKKK
jgi:hypothetical protein